MAKTVMTFQDLFELGMKRRLPELLTCEGPKFDCGSSGTYKVPGAIALGPPDWRVPINPIPAEDDTVAEIHAYHFLEHLTGEEVVWFLRESERVLIPERGVLNFSMPYYNSNLQAQNLDHKFAFCEETFDSLFVDRTYEFHGTWKLRVHVRVIMAVYERNLAIMGQLTKGTEVTTRKWSDGGWSWPAAL